MDSHDATKAQVPTGDSSLPPQYPAYWWFKGDSVKALAQALLASNLDTAILKIRPDGGKLYLSVLGDVHTIPDGGNEYVEINDSLICPPICIA